MMMQVKRDITLDIMNDKTNYDNTITVKFEEDTVKKCAFCPYCGRKKYKKSNVIINDASSDTKKQKSR
jgi:hypothetical protein